MPARPGQPARYDAAYRRAGTAPRVLCVQPWCDGRHVNVTAHRTTGDGAVQMPELIDVHGPEADVLTLGVANLKTHTPAALSETCTPAEARRMTRQLALP